MVSFPSRVIILALTLFVLALVRGLVSAAWSVPQRNPSDLHHVLFVGDLLVVVQLRTLDSVHRFCRWIEHFIAFFLALLRFLASRASILHGFPL